MAIHDRFALRGHPHPYDHTAERHGTRMTNLRRAATAAPAAGPNPVAILTTPQGTPTLVDQGAELHIHPPRPGMRMKYFTPLAATHLIDALVLVIAAPITNFAPEPKDGA
jgi:hypothetical protein